MGLTLAGGIAGSVEATATVSVSRAVFLVVRN